MIVGLLCEPQEDLSAIKNLAEGIEYLSKTDFTEMESGTYHIHDDDLFYIVCDYETKLKSECSLESHMKYIDIHCMVKGSEKIGYAPLTDQKIVKKYMTMLYMKVIYL
jgi:biofilm protein TabA